MNLNLPICKCKLCPRLVNFRNENKIKYPSYYNGAVESFGNINSELLIVGLAPGLNGANQTNRPFTNDYAGDVLYPILKEFGFAKGEYKKIKNDDYELINTRVTNAVRCVPPKNKVTGDEIRTCGSFLINEISAMPNLKLILTLGIVAHNAVLQSLGYQKSKYKFGHNKVHHLEKHNIKMINSYHTSRYNINTGVLTNDMFKDVVRNIIDLLQNKS